MKTKVAVTGLSGLIGQQLWPSFAEKYELTDLFHSRPTLKDQSIQAFQLDLTDKNNIQYVLETVQPDVILHLAAKTHIDACQQDEQLQKNSLSWQINVDSTQALAEYCRKTYAHLILMSTECVFDGQKETYEENDPTNPINWYGATKAAAEKILINAEFPSTIVRAVIAYTNNEIPENTLYSHILKSLKTKKTFSLVNDQWITPTYIPDLITALATIIDQQALGIFHVCPNQAITPFTFGQTLANHFKFDSQLVKPTTLVDFLGKERAKLRAKHACLDSSVSSQKLNLHFLNIQEVLDQ